MSTVDLEAEKALLGACLLDERAFESAMGIISAHDFQGSKHAQVWDAISRVYAEGKRADPLLVAGHIPGDALNYLTELQLATYSVSLAPAYAERIAEAKLRQRIILAAGQLQDDAMHGDPLDVVQRAQVMFEQLDQPIGGGEPDLTVDQFIGSVDMDHDWLIPDFLERGDRLLITGIEGGGKSLLLAQIATMAAAGLHPWNYRQVDPVNVLVVDVENGPRMVTRRYSYLRSLVGGKLDPARLRIVSHPRGIDLTTAQGKRWLLDKCLANHAEMLVIGPAYRLSSGVAQKGDTGGEDQAKRITAALDDIRTRAGVTLLMETHAPHGNGGFVRDLRPFGSSVWLRWPEFGLGIRKDPEERSRSRYVLEHWRGPRDHRAWPQYLDRDGQWPWTPVMPQEPFRKSKF
jgi:hypothetical protein